MTHGKTVSLSISTLLFGLVISTASAFAQQVPDKTVAAAVGNMGNRAGVVFAGEVIAIRHIDDVVEIDFRVSQNVKAANAGSYTLREWSGLWAAGQRRYWIGERAVVFLNPAGKSGLSSSVDGMEGVLPIEPDATNTLVVDVQRLRARVVREAGAPMVQSAGQMSLVQVAAAVNPRSVSAPVAYPPMPIRSPIARPLPRPIQSPIGIEFANQRLATPQNSVVLVMNPDEIDDVFSTDDVDTKHKTADTVDASR